MTVEESIKILKQYKLYNIKYQGVPLDIIGTYSNKWEDAINALQSKEHKGLTVKIEKFYIWKPPSELAQFHNADEETMSLYHTLLKLALKKDRLLDWIERGELCSIGKLIQSYGYSKRFCSFRIMHLYKYIPFNKAPDNEKYK